MNVNNVIKVIILNFLMLIAGFIGEIGAINMYTASIIGFIPFLGYFTLIYLDYLKPNYEKEIEAQSQSQSELSFKKKVYWYFVIFWSLYGVASFFPYVAKNTTYNILDLFAKNFFGIFLVWLLWRRKEK